MSSETTKANSKPKVKPENPSSGDSSEAEDTTMENLRRYLANKLGISNDDEETSGERVKVLTETNIDGITEYIKERNCKNIITMAGAGISTSAGIPDFRSPGTGLYHNLQKYNLPHPQAIFELDFFATNPRPFFELAKELYPGSFKPTICHYFVKLLNDKGMLLRHYTQNIDTLERVAGMTESKIVEAHGTFHTGHCMECRDQYSQDWIRERIFRDDIPICEKCPGVVKPDIVFFGEAMPKKFHKCLKSDFANCDLLIILGSSLAVEPFASLVDRVPVQVPRLLINREKAGHRTGVMATLGIGKGLDFAGKNNTRDVLWLGDCDEGCQLLADKLGWGDELRELCKKEHERIDKETKKSAKPPSKNVTKGENSKSHHSI